MIKYTTISKLRRHQRAVAALDKYKGPASGTVDEVREDDGVLVNVEMTDLLRELGRLNARRDEIMAKIMGDEDEDADRD